MKILVALFFICLAALTQGDRLTAAQQPQVYSQSVVLAENLPYVSRSGTITSGTVSQVLSAARTDRHYIIIQNISNETMGIGFGAAATLDTPSILIPPGGVWEPIIPPTNAINIIGTTTGKKFVCYES